MKAVTDRPRPLEPIDLCVDYAGINAFFADYARNIGRGGTFVQTDRPLDIGTKLRFTLNVPSLPNPISLLGQVQWRVTPEQSHEGQPPGMGIGFLYASEAERVRLDNTVESLMRSSLGPDLCRKLLAQTRNTLKR